MEKKTPLLDEIGRKHGMKVPGNYFADFTEKMTESLPEREFPELVQASGKTVDLYGSHVCRYMAYDENVYGNILGGKRRNS